MLATVDNGKKISYGYDHTGNRVRKTVDGVTTDYCMAGDLLVAETSGDKIIWYKYDSAANLISIRAYGKEFFYIKNLQNDVIALAKFLLSLYSLIPVTIPLIIDTTRFPVAPPIPINPTAVPKPDTAADNQSTSSKLFLSITI